MMPVEDSHYGVRSIPRCDDPILTEILRRRVDAYRPRSVFLFGSAARGDAGPDSDYDVLVVVPDDAARNLLTERLAYEVLAGTGVAVDVVVYRASDFIGRLPLQASLPATVAREGRLLYAG